MAKLEKHENFDALDYLLKKLDEVGLEPSRMSAIDTRNSRLPAETRIFTVSI